MKSFYKITILIALLVISCAVKAQIEPSKFSLKLGIGGTSFDGYYPDVKDRFSFTAGLTFEHTFPSDWVLMTGVEIVKKGSKIDGNYHKGYVDVYYLQFPLHMGYRVNLSDDVALIPHVGAYLSYGLYGRGSIPYIRWDTGEKHNKKENVFDEYMVRDDVGIGTGLSLDIGSMIFDIRYQYGLLNLGPYRIAIHNTNYTLSAAYRFHTF